VTGNAIVPSLDADFEMCSAGIRLGDWMCDGLKDDLRAMNCYAKAT
jgi:hypothetical protein